jgi:hypothetical protein
MLFLLLGQAPRDPDGPAPRSRVVRFDEKPVTRSEAARAFRTVARSLAEALSVRPATISLATAPGPVGKGETLTALSALVKSAAPAFRLTLPPATTSPKRWTLKTPAERALLQTLVKGGYVANIGPLATGKRVTLTTREFGDALGFALARIAEAANLPSTKWTPALQRN